LGQKSESKVHQIRKPIWFSVRAGVICKSIQLSLLAGFFRKKSSHHRRFNLPWRFVTRARTENVVTRSIFGWKGSVYACVKKCDKIVLHARPRNWWDRLSPKCPSFRIFVRKRSSDTLHGVSGIPLTRDRLENVVLGRF
jgi:hypothetical protein